MHRTQIGMSLVGVMLVGLGFTAISQPRAAEGPCEQIAAACQRAGFVQGDARGGNGLIRDCVEPIIQGTKQPPRATIPLPQIDPQLVASCKAKDPRFGQGRAAATPAAPVPVAPSAPLPTHPAAAGAPNIVFILTDDLAWNLVQYMPHVLQMQKDGVTFTNYFVTDSLCCPSRTSIFTGRYPHDTGVFKNTGDDGGYSAFTNHGLEQVTFARSLAAAGYRTAMLGKYLNGYEPPRDAAAPGWSMWGVGGSNGYRAFVYNLNEDGKVVRYGADAADYLTDVLSGLGARFIRQSSGTPFLIELATYAPHAPYVPAPRDADAFPGLQAPRTASFDAAPDASAPGWLRHRSQPLSDADKALIDRDFRKRAQSVLAVDKMIGELQEAVAAGGQTKNTYFIFSSDNGYHMGEHRLMPGKMTAFDEDIRVPLIVTGPGVPAGRTLDAIVENIDLCPTFTELASAAAPANVDGHSLVPLLHGQTVPAWRTVALVEHHGPNKDPTDPDLPAARSGNPTTYEAIRLPTSLYVEYNDGTKEYHDLRTDPAEVRNTFASLSGAEKASLSATLAAISTCHDAAACWAAARPDRVAATR
jgi:N-acetylglucosamine-6-sulfatase